MKRTSVTVSVLQAVVCDCQGGVCLDMFPCFPVPLTPLCRVLFQTRYKTNEPVWEEAFTFLIHNPKSQELEVEVRRRPLFAPKLYLLNFCRLII